MSTHFEYLDLNTLLAAFRDTPASVNNAFFSICGITRAKHGLSTHRRIRTVGVTDYDTAKNKVWSWLEEHGYRIFRITYDWLAIKDHTNKYLESVIHVSILNDTLSVKMRGSAEEGDRVVAWLETNFSDAGALVRTATHLSSRDLIDYTTKYMKYDDSQLAHQSFYPWLPIPLAEYYKAYMESEESILVLYGPAGTGKSTFLRTLIASGNYEATLAYSKDVLQSPKLISDFYKGPADILACEDIDLYLKSREDGNQLMSTILNASEGVVKHRKKKIVFSTNLPSIDRIDPALLRVGRCFDILHFRELVVDEAQAVARQLGISDRVWDTQKTWPLAEVLAKKHVAQQTINRFAKKTGFM